MTPPRLTPEHEAEIHAEFRKSGRVSALDVAYLLDELNAVRKEREELWMLLDNIDTLDDACRSDDARFRELARRQQKRRFDIYNPGTPPTVMAGGWSLHANPEPPHELLTCRHIWEADDQGVQCCALCGATAK